MDQPPTATPTQQDQPPTDDRPSPTLMTVTQDDTLGDPVLTALLDDYIRETAHETTGKGPSGHDLRKFSLTPSRRTQLPTTTPQKTYDPPTPTPMTSTQRKTPIPPTLKRTDAEATILGTTSPKLPRNQPDAARTLLKDGLGLTRRTKQTTGLPQRTELPRSDHRPPTPKNLFSRHEHRGDKTRN